MIFKPNAPADLPAVAGKVRRGVVCLCGSTRFRAELAEANRAATMAGKIVLAPGVFGHSGDPLTDADKRRLEVRKAGKGGIRLKGGVATVK